MKKLFIILAISSVGFAACNSGSNEETNGGDSTAVAPITPDSVKAPESVTADTVNLDTNTVAPQADTTAKK